MNDRSILLTVVIIMLIFITYKIFYNDSIENIQMNQNTQFLSNRITSELNRYVNKLRTAFTPSKDSAVKENASNDNSTVKEYMVNRLKDIQKQADMAEGFMQALDNVSHLAAVDDKIRQQDINYTKLKNEEYKVKKLIDRLSTTNK